MKKNIAVFGDISTNGIDGSSIWLQSICNVFPKDKYNIYLILRDKIITNVILDGLVNVNVIDVFNSEFLTKKEDGSCTPYELFTILNALDKSIGLEHIILRAPRFVLRFTEKARGNPSYQKLLSKTDVYFAQINVDYDYERRVLSEAQRYINRLIVQTEEARSLSEMFYPNLVNRVIVLNPMVPDQEEYSFKKQSQNLNKVSIVYSGKLDKTYCVEGFADLAIENKELYQTVFIGSKANSNKEDRTFSHRILEKLKVLDEQKDIVWIKELERKDSILEIAKASFIMAIREPKYDASIEVSTKLLEAMTVGCLPILRKNAANVALLGEDYPYYCDIVENISKLEFQQDSYEKWVRIVQEKAKSFSFSSTFQRRLAPYYEQIDIPVTIKKTKVLIASHDNKFLTEVIKYIKSIKDVEVRFDLWSTTNKHDLKKSQELLEWADVILCEWAVGPAVFYSNNKKEHQKLLVRLHRFEITTPLPAQIDFDAVDNAIVVSPYLKEFCTKTYGWPKDKITILPQYVNTVNFDRTKINSNSYRYNLGLLGIVPKLKRLDRAVELIEQLRKVDPRYVLHIKSKMPWDIPFVWNKTEEQDFYFSLFKRINESPLLKNGIVFHQYGNDVADWFRRIGWILSTSEIEGCHTAVAEAMSNGIKPVLFNWKGVEGVYRDLPIFSDVASASSFILEENKNPSFSEESLKEYALSNFDVSLTIEHYKQFILS